MDCCQSSGRSFQSFLHRSPIEVCFRRWADFGHLLCSRLFFLLAVRAMGLRFVVEGDGQKCCDALFAVWGFPLALAGEATALGVLLVEVPLMVVVE